MNTLPPLPAPVSLLYPHTSRTAMLYTDSQMEVYALAAIAAQAQPAAKALSERFALQHVAYADEDGLHWLSGRHVENCELYAMPGYGNAPALYMHPAEAQPVQPTPLQPLSRDRIAKAAFDAGYRSTTSQGRRDFICGILHGEQAHGIGSPGAPVAPTLSLEDAK